MNSQLHRKPPKPSFIEAWCFLSDNIGSSRLPINRKANDIHQFIIAQDDQLGFMKQVIRDCYQSCKCNHLQSPVNIETILDVLGETAYQLTQQDKDDLVIIELLEEIGWLLVEAYGQHLKHTQQTQNTWAEIISLPDHKMRRANLQF